MRSEPRSPRAGLARFAALSTAAAVIVACGARASPATILPATTATPTAPATIATPTALATIAAPSVEPTPAPTETTIGVTRIEVPDLGGGLEVVGGAVWVATDSGAVRVDPATKSVSEIIPGVTNLSFDGQRLWAGGEVLMELDPRTGEVLRQLTLEHGAYYLAASPDAIWATDTSREVVQRIDPSDGHVVTTMKVPARPKGTTLGDGSVWVACDGAAKVVRIDASTNEIVAEIAVDDGPHNIAVGGGSVWVTNRHSETASRIDPATDKVVATVTGVAGSPAVGVVTGPEDVYVAAPGGVAIIDPRTAQITGWIVTKDTAFYDLELIGNTLWASDAASPTLYGFDLDAIPHR